MNKACLTVFLLLPGFAAKAQADTPEKFLAMVPKPAVIRSYRPPAGGGADPLRSELQDKLQQMDATLKSMEQRLKEAVQQRGQKMAADMGVPPEVAQGKKRMTKEERRALADQALKAQLGPGAPSYQELQAMSPEARRAWAASYGNQMAGQARANPGKFQPPQNLPKAQDIQRLQALQQEIQAVAGKYKGRYQALNLELAELSKPSGRDYSSAAAVSPEDRQRAVRTVAPKLASLVDEQMAEVRTNLGKWKEADDLLARQNGLEKSPTPGLQAMKVIRDGLQDLSKSLAGF